MRLARIYLWHAMDLNETDLLRRQLAEAKIEIEALQMRLTNLEILYRLELKRAAEAEARNSQRGPANPRN